MTKLVISRVLLTDILRRSLWRFGFRGKARLLQAVCPRQGEVGIDFYGNHINLDLEDYIQRSIYLNTFEPWESAVVKSYLKPGMVFVDVGANVGYYTLIAASLVGGRGKVFAFEPSPYAFTRLKETVQRNHLTQVETINAGLSDRNEVAKLQLPRQKGNHTPSMVSVGADNVINVPVYRLDDYLTKNEVSHVDLVKIDVEGFEPNILKGASDYLVSGKIGAVLCEFNQHWLKENNCTPQALHELLKTAGFQTTRGVPNWRKGCQNLFYIRS